MKTKDAIAKAILPDANQAQTQAKGSAFAPSNIALIKYWGKRNETLHLPVTNSLSVSLGHLGCHTVCGHSDSPELQVIHNKAPADPSSPLHQGILKYFHLLGLNPNHCQINIDMNIPMAAGVASSACGFAALICALNDWHGWGLNQRELSILARLGSGSACRSLWQGFVEWERGEREDGMDSYASPLTTQWDDLCVGIVQTSTESKPIGSREAMRQTMATSKLYQQWSAQVIKDLTNMKAALQKKDFEAFGSIAESNAIAMHATMLDATPPIDYSNELTKCVKEQILQLRQDGVLCYFTQDAGPNVKILFLKKDTTHIEQIFSKILIAHPFKSG